MRKETIQGLAEAIRLGNWHNDYMLHEAQEFLGCPADHVFRVYNEYIGRYLRNMIVTALDGFLATNEFSIFAKKSIGNSGFQTPKKEDIEIAPKVFKSCFTESCYFLEKDNTRLILEFQNSYHNDGWWVTVFYKDTSEGLAKSFLKDLETYAKEHNYLKTAKIDASLSFIPKTDYTWDDIVLPAKTKQELQVNVDGMISNIELYKKNSIKFKRGLILKGPPGCQPAGSKVLMMDGTFKDVQDIIVGDIVLSPQADGSVLPSKVTELKQYSSPIFRVSTKDGNFYRCASEHVLVLDSLLRKKKAGKRVTEHKTLEVIADNAYSFPDHVKVHLNSIQTQAVPFLFRSLPIQPYLLGLLIGDGCLRHGAVVTTADKELLEYLEGQALQLGMSLVEKSHENNTSKDYLFKSRLVNTRDILGRFIGNNELINKLKRLGLFGKLSGNKFIPQEYLQASISQRLDLLAGLLDSDGHCYGSNYEYTTKSKQLGLDVQNLCKSLGFRASLKDHKIFYRGEQRLYYRLHISPQDLVVPTLLPRKQHTIRDISWKNARHAHCIITPEGHSEIVYGFVLDSASQWYVTDNWVITHNTGKTLIGKILCNSVACTFLWVTPRFLERSQHVKIVCDMARELSPSILFLEDIDLYSEDRRSVGNATLLGELMNQLDGLIENHFIIVIATTNRVDDVEEALRNRPGRFDRILDIGLPSSAGRLRMLELFTKKYILDGVDLQDLASKIDGYSGAHVKELVITAAITAIDEKSLTEDGMIILKAAYFNDNIGKVRNKKIEPVAGFGTPVIKKANFDDADDDD